MSSNPHGREALPAEFVQFRAEVIQFEFDSRVVVALSGELDLATAPMLRASLDSPLLHGTADVEIDMAELTYLDSAGMSVLVQHWRDLNGRVQRLTDGAEALRYHGADAPSTE